MKSRVKVCYVVAYRDPNYTRTNSLINALKLIDGVELLVIKNRHRGWWRYFEVPPRLFWARLRFKPDVFIVGFRADEIFWAFYPVMLGKKIIFDEFVNLHDWLADEHRKLKPNSVALRVIDGYMKWVTKKSDLVLTDTRAHAKLTSQTYGLPPAKIVAVPVGADETVFYPRKFGAKTGKFEVFFYGTALPLHGVDVILEAAKIVAAKNRSLHFTLVGGRDNLTFLGMVNGFVTTNQLEDMVSLEPWVDYQKLPERIAASGLCLGGPFGGTGQARRVVSGKTYQFLAMAKPTVIGKMDDTNGFSDKRNCLLVDQASAEALAGAIIWAFEHKKELPKIGQAGRQLFEREFSSKAIASQLKGLL